MNTNLAKLAEKRQAQLESFKKEEKIVDEMLLNPDLDDSQRTNLLRKKSSLEALISRQLHLINHKPNLNYDCFTFLSSTKKEGFDKFRQNLRKAISRLPVIKLQDHWSKPTELLLNKKEAIILFDDFLPESGLDKEDLMQMLRALHAMTRIVWLDGLDLMNFIFPHKEVLAQLTKCISHRKMQEKIS